MASVVITVAFVGWLFCLWLDRRSRRLDTSG